MGREARLWLSIAVGMHGTREICEAALLIACPPQLITGEVAAVTHNSHFVEARARLGSCRTRYTVYSQLVLTYLSHIIIDIFPLNMTQGR